MHTTSPSTGRGAAALASAVRDLETLERQRQRREHDAAQVRLFARALALASPEHCGQGTAYAINGRDQAELAYRSVRAELALAPRSSAHSTERRLSQAYELTSRYPDTLECLASRAISLAHTEAIVAAGRVMGEGLSAPTAARRAAYESSVLEHARSETPARLRPIAWRLAARYTERRSTAGLSAVPVRTCRCSSLTERFLQGPASSRSASQRSPSPLPNSSAPAISARPQLGNSPQMQSLGS